MAGKKKSGDAVTSEYLHAGLLHIAMGLEKPISAKKRRDGMKTFATALGWLSVKHQRLIIDMVEEVVPMLKKTHATSVRKNKTRVASARKEKRHG